MTKNALGEKIAAIILSAGKSERMGVQKFSLRFDDQCTFLEKIISVYHDFSCDEIVVVMNPEGVRLINDPGIEYAPYVKIAVNQHPEWERLYSLKTGATALTRPGPVFVSNVDNPFVSNELLHELEKQAGDYDYVYPAFNGKGGHPFMLSERVVRDLLSEPEDNLHLKEFLGRYSSLAVEVDDARVLVNINTPEEYQNYFGQD